VTNSSDLAAIKCKNATISVQMGAGLGYSIPQPVVSAINFILQKLNIGAISGSGGSETYQTLYKNSESEPNTKGCAL
jgi:hypothetical protein